jgi:hypothetical protein
MLKRWGLICILTLSMLALYSMPAAACGGPLSAGQNIHLQKSETLVAWHNGTEYYMTNFTYTTSGDPKNFGWVLPLPAEPQKIEAGDLKTFETLHYDSQRPTFSFNLFSRGNTAGAPGGAQVLQQTRINSLDITIVKGNGSQIVEWATQNGFNVDEMTRAHLLQYAKASPIFMAAKYDLSSVTQEQKDKQLKGGVSTPVLLTIKTSQLWVPMELLAVEGQYTSADFYLLTDQPVHASSLNAKLGISSEGSGIANAPGLTLNYQGQLSDGAYTSIKGQTNMGWVWPKSWLTYLSLSAPGEKVTYDVGISPSGVVHSAPYGTQPAAVIASALGQELPSWLPALPVGSFPYVLAGLIILLIGGLIFWLVRRDRRNKRELASKAI